MSMCSTIGVTISDSTTEILIVLYSQYNIGAPMCSAKDSMDLWIYLVLLTPLYMH